MKIKTKSIKMYAAVCVASSAFAFATQLPAQGIPTPGLTVTQTATNQLRVTITNGLSTANYELYSRLLIDPVFPWKLQTIGTTGQTNFTVSMDTYDSGFFEIFVGNDWDGDGIPNYMDASPTNSGVGALSITIQSPANGTIYN